MNIEEIAFKDRTELAHLNGIDLLNIIEFLQKDRQQWINQFSKTHNESVEIQAKNRKLKDNWNKLKEYVKENIRIYKNRHYDLVYDIEEVPKEQQKEFIHYLVVESMQALIEKIEQGSDSNE